MRTTLAIATLLVGCGGTPPDPPQESTGQQVPTDTIIGWCDKKAVGELSEPLASGVTAKRCADACAPILAAIEDGGADPLPLPLYCSLAWPF